MTLDVLFHVSFDHLDNDIFKTIIKTMLRNLKGYSQYFFKFALWNWDVFLVISKSQLNKHWQRSNWVMRVLIWLTLWKVNCALRKYIEGGREKTWLLFLLWSKQGRDILTKSSRNLMLCWPPAASKGSCTCRIYFLNFPPICYIVIYKL